MTKPADQIAVKAFHHVLLWPVLMRGPGGDQKIEAFVRAFEAAGWEEQTAPAEGVHPDYTYAEVVYFHPFVRDFLFGDGQTPREDRNLRRFKRRGVTAVTVEATTDAGSFTKTLRVERVELLLIRPRVAMLVVEVSNRNPAGVFAAGADPAMGDARTPLTLADVLYLQSQLRHIYPPYFGDGRHGDCPVSVSWRGLPAPAGLSAADPSGEFEAFTRAGAEPPVYAHWRAFFCDAAGVEVVRPLRTATDKSGPGLFLHQLLDDRMPGQSFVAVADPANIAPGDADRFAAFDPPGLDYEARFNDQIRDGQRYTRFAHWGTTYYGNGTSFVVVCNAGDFSNVLLGHFRRHYTHLAVLAQFQHAALLYFADELADTAKLLAKRPAHDEFGDRNWRDRIRVLQHRFLKFRTRAYFTEVSNQVQGKDLFRFWTRHLGTAELFERVADTNGQVYQALETHEVRELAEAQTKMTEAQTRMAEVQTKLALAAYVGLPVTIVLAALATVFAWVALYPEANRVAFVTDGELIRGPWQWLFVAVGVSVAVLVVTFFLLGWVARNVRVFRPR